MCSDEVLHLFGRLLAGMHPWSPGAVRRALAPLPPTSLSAFRLVLSVIILSWGIGGWGVSQPGNLNGSCVHDPVAGVLELQ